MTRQLLFMSALLESEGEQAVPIHQYCRRYVRLQIAVSVCFAMTINKSQGQTLRAADVDLRTSFYKKKVVLVSAGETNNVVYKENTE